MQVDPFLDSLIHYDKENIHEGSLKAIRPYLEDKDFNADNIRSKSLAAAGLCAWAINIVRFYEVYCDVEPKRLALIKANDELKAAQDKFAVIKAKIMVRGYSFLMQSFFKSVILIGPFKISVDNYHAVMDSALCVYKTARVVCSRRVARE